MKNYIKTIVSILLFQFLYIEASAQMGTCESFLIPIYSFNSAMPFAIDEYGNKWMGSLSGGLLKFTNIDSSWTIYNTSNSGIPSNCINSIAIDSNNNKWIGTGGGGLAKFDDMSWTIYNTSNSGLLYNNVVDLTIDGFGNKWISCKGTSPGTPVAMMKFDDISWTTIYTEMNNMYVYNMYIANDSVLWYQINTAYPQSLIYRNCISGSTAYYDNTNTPMNNPNMIVVENNGTEWMAATNGLFKHHNSNWTNYNTGNSGIPSNSIFKMFLDRTNNIWFTPTMISSIAKFDGLNWYKYDSSNTCFGTNKIWFLGLDSSNIWAFKYTDTTCFLVKISGLLSGIHYIPQPINNFTIFPNPCNGAFTISYGALEPAIYIYNILGKLVYQKEKAAQGSEVIDISEYTKGIYFVKVQSGENVYTDKVIVE